jgi:hypothetical protein
VVWLGAICRAGETVGEKHGESKEKSGEQEVGLAIRWERDAEGIWGCKIAIYFLRYCGGEAIKICCF